MIEAGCHVPNLGLQPGEGVRQPVPGAFSDIVRGGLVQGTQRHLVRLQSQYVSGRSGGSRTQLQMVSRYLTA